MEQITWHCKSSDVMAEVESDGVGLVVTSPPYLNAIQYDAHLNGCRYDSKNSVGSVESYFDSMRPVFRECFRVLKPGAYVAVVVASCGDSKFRVPLPSLYNLQLLDLGFEFQDEIIWHKCTGGVKRFGVTIQHPRPRTYYPNIMHEMILIHRKPGPKIPTTTVYEITDLDKCEIANSVWHIAPVPPNANAGHPCPFPLEIPWRLVKWLSEPGDIVLDPFAGIGTTGVAAVRQGRRAVCYEMLQDYVDRGRAFEVAAVQKENVLWPKFISHSRDVRPS